MNPFWYKFEITHNTILIHTFIGIVIIPYVIDPDLKFELYKFQLITKIAHFSIFFIFNKTLYFLGNIFLPCFINVANYLAIFLIYFKQSVS